MRDPRKDPAAGDVVTRYGTTRVVMEIITNERGTISHVVYGHPVIDSPLKTATISSWRAWTKIDAMVVSTSAET